LTKLKNISKIPEIVLLRRLAKPTLLELPIKYCHQRTHEEL